MLIHSINSTTVSQIYVTLDSKYAPTEYNYAISDFQQNNIELKSDQTKHPTDIFTRKRFSSVAIHVNSSRNWKIIRYTKRAWNGENCELTIIQTRLVQCHNNFILLCNFQHFRVLEQSSNHFHSSPSPFAPNVSRVPNLGRDLTFNDYIAFMYCLKQTVTASSNPTLTSHKLTSSCYVYAKYVNLCIFVILPYFKVKMSKSIFSLINLKAIQEPISQYQTFWFCVEKSPEVWPS